MRSSRRGLIRSPAAGEAPRSTKRAWLTLVAVPFILAVTFLPVVAYVATTRGLEGDALLKAVEPIAPLPASIGFGVALLLTGYMARRDGLSLEALGWSRPKVSDLVLGLALGVAVAGANASVLYPWIQRLRPTFDPTLQAVPLPLAAAALLVAAVAEDTLYRGYAFVVLRQRFGAIAAIAATSVFYALLAPGQGWPLSLWALAFGTTLCVVRHLRGSLWPVLVTHGIVALAPKVLASFP